MDAAVSPTHLVEARHFLYALAYRSGKVIGGLRCEGANEVLAWHALNLLPKIQEILRLIPSQTNEAQLLGGGAPFGQGGGLRRAEHIVEVLLRVAEAS